MKKTITIILVILVTAMIIGCGGSGGGKVTPIYREPDTAGSDGTTRAQQVAASFYKVN